MPKSFQHLGFSLAIRLGFQRFRAWLISLLIMVGLAWTPPVWAALPQGNAVQDPAAILRDSLPMNQEDLRDLQHLLEYTSDDLRAKRWSALGRGLKRTQSLLSNKKDAIVAAMPSDDQAKANQILDAVADDLNILQERIEEKDKAGFIQSRRETLSQIGDLEALLIDDRLPDIPSEFDDLPRLAGRATVVIETTEGDLTAVVDGYNAPLTAGAFIDLSLKGFYDGLPLSLIHI